MVQGIGLFTYHKYRKSIDSTVSLDAHGNPIMEDDTRGSLGDAAYIELSQTERPTYPDGDRRVSYDDEHVSSSANPVQSLTSCGRQGDDTSTRHTFLSASQDGADDARELRSVRSFKVREVERMQLDARPVANGAANNEPIM